VRDLVIVSIVVFTSGCALLQTPPTSRAAALVPVLETAPVANDADDPAIWINREDPARSLVLGTNKVAAPDGALYVFDLQGRIRQRLAPLDRPNNVDVEYGLATAAGPVDIAVVTERLQHRVRVFQVADRGVVAIDGGGIPVLEGMTGEASEPMGIAVYRRPNDGVIFAIVAPKSGSTTNYLWQYRLEMDPASGLARGRLVRRFGNFSGTAEIEAVAVDDELGHVYYSDEQYAVRKWHADPDNPDAARELGVFGRSGFTQQREGIAVVDRGNGTGYIVVSDQINGGTRLHVYPREGWDGASDAHDPALLTIRTSADSTDGLDVAAAALPGEFARGLLVMMNSRGRNFQFYRWADVERYVTRSESPKSSVRNRDGGTPPARHALSSARGGSSIPSAVN
jgi:3-phytase